MAFLQPKVTHKDLSKEVSAAVPMTISLPADYSPGKTPGVILTHGASGNHHNEQLLTIATKLALGGVAVLRFTCNSPSLPNRVKAFAQAFAVFSKGGQYPVSKCVVSGRSMGSRAATQFANENSKNDLLVGVICFAYPLHPPGDKAKLRNQLLEDLSLPALLISGTNDAFCDLALMNKTLAKVKANGKAEVTLVTVPGGDHSYKAKGGKAVYEKNVKVVTDSALSWAKSKFGLDTTEAPWEPKAQEEEKPTATRKRKEPTPNNESDGDSNEEEDEEEAIIIKSKAKRTKRG